MPEVYYKDVAKDITQMTFADYLFRLSLMAKSVFTWKGLPNGMDEKFIEGYLFHHGNCMGFTDPNLGPMIAKCTAGDLNYYDEPVKLTPVATNYPGELKTYTNGVNAVLIHNNDQDIPTYRTIVMYAARLAEMQRTIDINVNAMKTPVLIKCTDKQRLAFQQVYKKWDGNGPLVVVDKTMDIEDSFKVLKTDAPIVFDKLMIEKNKLWNECMTFLGINNANMDKRERLVDDEVQANNEQIALSAQIMLKARQRAARQLSELWGVEVTVELRKPCAAPGDALEPDMGHPEGGGEE